MNSEKLHLRIAPELNLPEDMALKCSCSACDSIACFARRQVRKNCSCNKCPSSTNLFINDISTHLIEDQISTEFVKSEVTYDDNIEGLFKTNEDVSERQSEAFFRNIKNTSEEMLVERDYNIENPSQHKMSTTAQLSAQIMNVPYEQFEELRRRQEPLINFPTLSPFDILQKIKEVYKACSCKVCDCIVGKTERNEFCKCKPCDCQDCKTYNREYAKQLSERDQNLENLLGCAFSRCDKYICRAVTQISSRQNECNCTPCECIKCTDNKITTPCDCEPCQCIECRAKNVKPHQSKARTLVVATVSDDYQTRGRCQCMPCDCTVCSHRISSSPLPSRHEISTGLNRHPQCRCETCTNDACLPDGTNVCKCERRNKVMRKPVERDHNDYDIRTALVHPNMMDVTGDKNRYTIAMFAALNNNYPYYDTTSRCKCSPCECLKCSYKENVSRTTHHTPNKYECYSISNANGNKYMYNNKELYSNTDKSCNCDVCDCLNCTIDLKRLSDTTFKTKIKDLSKANCNCNLCQCTNCDRVINKCAGKICQCASCKCNDCIEEIMYPVKEGKRFLAQTMNNQQSKTKCFVDDRYIHTNLGPSIIMKPQNYDLKIEEQELLDIEKYRDISPNIRNINKESIDLFQKSPSVSTSNSSRSDNPKYFVQFPKDNIETGFSDLTKSKERNLSPENSFRSTKTMRKTFNVSATFCEFNKYNKRPSARLDRPIRNHFKTDRLSYDECSSIDNKTLYTEATISNQFTEKTSAKIESYNGLKQYDNGRLIDRNKYFEETEIKLYKDSNYNRKPGINNNRKPHKSGLESQEHFSINNNVSLDKDYERVQKTLEDAREFSQHLMKLLEKYEKANKEFESVSNEFKYFDNDKSLELNIIGNEITEFLESEVLNTPNNHLVDYLPSKENVFDINDKKKSDINKNIIETNSGGDDVTVQFKEGKLLDLHLHNNENNSEHESRFKYYENILNPIIEENEPSPEKSITRRVKKFNKLYRHVVKVLNKPKLCVPNIELNCASTETSIGLSIDDEEKYSKTKEKEIDKENPIDNNNKLETNNNSVNCGQRMVRELETIKDQNFQKADDKIIRMIKPPMHLKSETEFTQSIVIKKNSHNKIPADHHIKINEKGLETHSSLDDLKVSLLRARRVSDHTVMVKWNVPRALKLVNGYELLLDGKAVHRILNASYSMAVVTCLPNVNKLLMTVRTVTNFKRSGGYSPTSTIIYRPRE